jgi:tRNA 5-methylaminomethyl-2-thiouridine biosynthesis bifunctional protein
MKSIPQLHPTSRAKLKNWLPESPAALAVGSRVAVIGAGIAGATVAAELAQAGMLVTVFEAADTPATAASGNIAGNCLPVVDRGNAPYNQWYWQAWQLAYQWWQVQDNATHYGDLTGAFKWSHNPKKQQTWQQWVEELANPDVAQWKSALPEAIDAKGIWFAQGGYLIPRQVIANLLDHTHIELRTSTTINALQRSDQRWTLHSAQDCTEVFDAVVIATGAQTANLLPEWSPFLQLNKGQVTHLSVTDWKTPPHFVLSYGGYAIPAVNGVTCVGATFEDAAPLGLDDKGQAYNLAKLRAALPTVLCDKVQPIGGHSAYRVMTADHLPIVGQVIDIAAYQSRVSPYVLHPDTCPDMRDLLVPNLWLNLGHGARGLTSSFLSARLLCAQITGQKIPVDARLGYAVHPCRLIFRQLVQNALR